MRTSIALAVLAGTLAACGDSAASRGNLQAVAVLEVIPPSAMPEGARPQAGDDAYLANAVEKVRLPQTLLRAVRDSHLAALPAFEGVTEDEIAGEIAAGLEVRVRPKAWLVEIVVRGDRREVVADEANAVAAAFIANETAAALSDADTRRLAAEQRLAVAEAQLGLLRSDTNTVLRRANFSQTTMGAELADLQRRRAKFVDASDDVALKLIAADAKKKTAAMTGDERKELLRQQQALADRVRALDTEIATAKDVSDKLDTIRAETTRQLEIRAGALREVDILRERLGESACPIRVVARAEEPAQPR